MHSSDQQNHGNPETKMLSAVTSTSYTMVNEFVYFTCYARDTDASQQGMFRWVYTVDDDFGEDIFVHVLLKSRQKIQKVVG